MDILSKLRQLEEIEGAYERWKNYRIEVTNYILNEVKTFDEITLLGAGRCNDLDISLLISKFKKVILVDKNEQTMEEGLKHYGLEKHPQVELRVEDFLGVEEVDYRNYIRTVTKCFDQASSKLQVEEVIRMLDEIKEKIRNYPLDLGKNNYQNVVLLGVHSQLNIYLAHIWGLYSEAFQKEENLIYEKIKIMNHLASKKLNTALIECTSECLFVGYEVSRLERKGRVEGAIQAENDLEIREALGVVTIQSEIETLWPFKPGCTYQMRVMCMNKQ